MAGHKHPRFIFFKKGTLDIPAEVDATLVWGIMGKNIIICVDHMDAMRLMLDSEFADNVMGVVNWYRLERGIERLIAGRMDFYISVLEGPKFSGIRQLEFWNNYYRVATARPEEFL